MTFAITIPGEPVAQGRPRFVRRRSGHVGTYDPLKSRRWKLMARTRMAAAVGEGFPLFKEGPLKVTIIAVFACFGYRRRRRAPAEAILHSTRPDVENVVKAVLDAGNGVVWKDDGQVAILHASKVQAGQTDIARVIVFVQELPEIAVRETGIEFQEALTQIARKA